MEPGHERPLPIRNGNHDKFPINQSGTDGIIDGRDRSNLHVDNSDDSPASTEQAAQNSTDQEPTAIPLPPIMRIPTEMRSKIFKYLLPDKSQNIEPTSILYERWKFNKEQDEEMIMRVVRRAHAQHRGTNDLLGFSQFYGVFDQERHNAGFRVEFEIGEFAVPLEFDVEAFGGVYDMPVMGGFGDGDGRGWFPESLGARFAVTSPPSAKKSPAAGLEGMFKQTSMSNQEDPFWPDSHISTNNDKPQPKNIFIDPPTPHDLINIKKALKEDQYDALPTDTTLSLLTTNSLFATEIATILYEEYTFDIRICADGIDLLHLPRINTSEFYGEELAEQIALFRAKGHFCLERMRRLCFVLVGGEGDVGEERAANWRMRRNMHDLVGMLGDELVSLDVRFSGDDEFWVVTETRENEGKVGQNMRPRMGMKDVSVAEMVCSPLAAGLRRVGKVELALPEGLEEVEGLIEWKTWFEGEIMGEGEMEKDFSRELKEIAMVEATREWEYRQEILGGGESFAYLEDIDVDMEDEEEDEEMELDMGIE